MKKRIMSCFMALALCLTLLPTAALAAADSHDPHCICGKKHTAIGDHTDSNEDANAFNGAVVLWDDNGTLRKGNAPWIAESVAVWGPGDGGKETAYALTGDTTYYLGSDIEITQYPIMITGDVKLCLNGKKITCGSLAPACVIGVYANDASTLTLTDCKDGGKITGGTSCGVKVYKGYTFNMYGGTITGNGSGVYLNGSGSATTTFNMYGGTIGGAVADPDTTGNTGVGVQVDMLCEFNMYGGTISNNGGRGVLVHGGTFTMKDGATITDNTVTGNNGGGVYVNSNSTFNMEGGTISNNKAINGGGPSGGGVYVNSNSTFNMKGGTISNNTADSYGGGVFVDSGTTFTVSGTPTITGNTQGSAKKPNNVYLSANKTITIGTGGLTMKGDTKPQIGVTVDSDKVPDENGSVNIATNAAANYGKNGTGYITSDNADCYVDYDRENQKMVLKGNPKISLTKENTTIEITNEDALVYSGSELTPTVKVTYDGTELRKDTDYTVSYANNTNAGTATVTVTGQNNYEGSVEKQWKITPLIVSVSSVTLNNKVYDGTTAGRSDDVVSVKFEKGSKQSVPLTKVTDYTIKSVTYTDANVSAKEQNIDVEVMLQNPNYTFAGNQLTSTVTKQGKIAKAPVNNTAQTGEINVVNNKAGSYTLNLNDLLPTLPNGRYYGKITYEPDKDSFNSDNYNVSGIGISTEDMLTLTIASANGEVGTTICNGKVTAQTQNYTDITLTINVKVVAANKIVPTGKPTLSKTTLAWGEQLSTITLSGTMTDLTDSTKTVKGKFEWVAPGAAKEKIGEYQAEWKFTPTDTAVYAETSGKVTIKVIKATPKGAPGYTKITTTGKTLKDANLTVGTIQPEGTIQWERGDTAEVKADTAYKWVFTPKDTEHYDVLTGSITPYSVSSNTGGSSSGGGSSSDRDSSDSNPVIKTETKNHPDGSTTKTETRKDGSVTQTTTGKDGSVSKTETKKDGSSVTENKAADGSTGTVKTDKNGQTEAKTALSNKAVEDARRNGEAVKAPVEVEASRNSSTAPTVSIELPKGAGETKVEIPVSNVKPGTVAVIVHPDGTEEILKDSIPTEDGIRLTVDGSATVKIVDNAKDFIDTQNHWAKDEIDFVSARELVNGISATRYAPDATATRAQLWTILARQNDTDLSGGANWYEKAQLWSKDKGISDGTNPNGTINRAQMVTMLWRTMGQPAAASGASFADVPAGSYYAQAVAWAVESGITAGVGGGRFDPTATCTRAQIAAFLARSMK